MINRRQALVTAAGGLAATLPFAAARAQAKEIRLIRQPGMGHLQMILAAELKLVEKHLAAAGAGDVKVSWSRLSGGASVSEALISGSADVTSGAITSLLTIWDRSRGQFEALTAINSQPMFLNTTNPAVKSIKDFTDADRIAVTGVKTSPQAIVLQMEAAKVFGADQFDRLDKLTVGMSHPDGHIALMSERSGVTAQFGSAPYMYEQLKSGKARKILDSYEALGGPHTFGIVWGSKSFFENNPVLTKALMDALAEATELIKTDTRRMAQVYVDGDRVGLPVEFVEEMFKDPQNIFTLVPQRSMLFADFMGKIGSLRNKPKEWKDFFSKISHGVQGS